MDIVLDDCWNRIGVRGDQSCNKLREHLHCRNCPVFADAARHIRQRELPPGYQRDWAAWFAAELPDQRDTDQSSLVFRIGQEWLALPTIVFASVSTPTDSHRLPHRPPGVLLGVVNVDGKLMPCVSLAALFGIGAGTASVAEPVRRSAQVALQRRLVLQVAAQEMACHVDEVHGVARHAKADLQAPPATVNKGVQRYLTGVLALGERQVGCLDAELIGYNLGRALT